MSDDPSADGEGVDVSEASELVVTVAVGLLGLVASIHDGWVGDASVNIYVAISRAATVVLACVAATGMLIATLVYEYGGSSYPVLLTTVALAVGAALPPFGHGAFMLFAFGSNPDWTVKVCNGDLPSPSPPPSRPSPCAGCFEFCAFLVESTALICLSSSIFMSVFPVARNFLVHDVAHVLGSIKRGHWLDIETRDWISCTGLLYRAAFICVFLLLDIPAALFCFLLFLIALLEVVVVIPGALLVSLVVTVVYVDLLENAKVHLSLTEVMVCDKKCIPVAFPTSNPHPDGMCAKRHETITIEAAKKRYEANGNQP